LVWGTRTKRLQSRDVPVPQDQWTIVPNVIKPILSRRVFNKAQARRRDLFPHLDSDEHLIGKLKPLLKRKGRLTEGIIDQCRSVPSSYFYAKRFGGLPRVYELLGCDKKIAMASRKRLQFQITKLYRIVLFRLRKVFGSQITVIRQRPKNRVKTVRFSNGFILSIAVCKHIKTSRGGSRWLFDNNSAKRAGHVTLLCFGNRANTQIKRFWLLPSIAHLAISSLPKEEDERLTTGKRIKRLSELKCLGIESGPKTTNCYPRS
jgi:hypothetical protein